VRGLEDHRLASTRDQSVHQVNVPAGRVEDRAGAGIGVQDPHDEIAAGVGGFRQQVYLVHDARIGDGQHSHGWLCWSSPTGLLRAADADVHAWRVVDEWFAARLRQPGRGD